MRTTATLSNILGAWLQVPADQAHGESDVWSGHDGQPDRATHHASQHMCLCVRWLWPLPGIRQKLRWAPVAPQVVPWGFLELMLVT